METTVTSLADCRSTARARYLSGAESVFWETANTTEFETQGERAAFQWRYFGYYAAHAPHLFFVSLTNRPQPEVVGYICGVADTTSHEELYRVAAHIPVFDDLYDTYPAHLHINITAAGRGLGLGRRLVETLETAVAAEGACGIHLVTSPGARNVSFYRRQGFVDAEERTLSTGGEPDATLLFLGKRLEHSVREPQRR